MLSLQFFKAGKGDSFLLTWGDKEQHHLLVDSGSPGTYRFLKDHVSKFGSGDSVLVTHVDYDHIGGFLKWVYDRQETVDPQVRFFLNTPQLVITPTETNQVAVDHGAKLEQRLQDLGIAPLSLFAEPGKDNMLDLHGLQLQILSPNPEILTELINKWTATAIYQQYQQDNLQQDNKVTGENELLISAESILSDPPKPHKWEDDLLNATSIAFILTYNGACLLFLGDANPEVVCAELERLGWTKDNRLSVNLVKISHHGSRHNTTQDLLERINCENYYISTDSSGPYYHPARETLVLLGAYGRPKENHPLYIYSNYALPLKRLITAEEQETMIVEEATHLAYNQ